MKATNGMNYVRHVWQSSRDGKWEASIAIQKPHKYGKRTAYGERMGWKTISHINVEGRFDSRKDALAAINIALKARGILAKPRKRETAGGPNAQS